MRLHRLEVEGFGPFRSRQVVDFDEFVDDGIFLIAGRTGAGKSSILDAVCFGLYGGVPRYDGGEKRLRSDYCAPDDLSQVVVEFSTPAGRYRVTRSPEYLRPAKRGSGLTKQAAAAALDEKTDAGWIGRAARAVDVAHALEEILQLTREQFLQVILLAQNRFSEFLLAGSKERQALLRRLFGTERFEDVQARFDERRRASEQVLGQRLAQLEARLDEAEALVEAEGLGPPDDDLVAAASALDAAPTPDTAARIDALRRAEARAAYRVERRFAERDDAERAMTAADAHRAEVRDQQIAQTERDRSRAALAALDAEAPQIESLRADLERARAAETLRGVIDLVDRARRDADDAERIESAAAEAWKLLEIDDAGETVDALRAWASARTRESGEWEHAARLEEQQGSRVAAIAEAQETLTAALGRLDQLGRERGELPDALARVRAAREDAGRRADRLDDLTALRDRAIVRGEAVQQLERLRDESAAAERALAEASEVVAVAQTDLATLRRRRLDGYAGELASTLTDDAPCPVCGATEHPAPAEHADPVSADDIDRAEAARDGAAQVERAASERVSDVRVRIAAAETLAEGRTPETALDELAALEAERGAALAARTSRDELDAEIAQLTSRASALDGEHAGAEQAVGQARAALAALEQSERDAEALIRAARGDAETVRQRIAAASVGIDAASALAAAREALASRRTALDEALAAQHSALADSPLDSVDDARAALQPAREREAGEERIRRYAVRLETEKGILLPLEMRALPEEPIDPAPAEAAAAEARSAWHSAVEVAGRAQVVVERLAGLLAAATAEHAQSADEAAEHEVIQGLADAIAGRGANTRKMTLETFVLAAELEEIVEAANRRLHDMSTGRYQLRHSDALAARGAASGLGIVVHDAFTGQTRPAQSLSGGETFLSSLALALGLAEVVTARAGGIRLDTLFIDEGFGSLDGDTLDVAMRTLDELRQGGRTVGVISHVEAMQDQIPAQLRVRATSEGPSVIETR